MCYSDPGSLYYTYSGLRSTHLAFLPDEMHARYPLLRLDRVGYRESETTGDRRAR